MNTRLALLVAIVMVIVSACRGASGPKIQVTNAWMRAATVLEMPHQGEEGIHSGDEMVGTMGGSNSAAYMIISNYGNQPDRLLTVSSDVAQAVELHVSEMKDGVMTMHQVDVVDVPTRGHAELKPGGLHVMLIGLKRDLNAGDQVKLILGFETSGEILIDAEGRSP